MNPRDRKPWHGAPDGAPRSLIKSNPSIMAEVGQRIGLLGAPGQIRDALDWLQVHTNLLLPIARVDAVPAGYRLTPSAVLLTEGEVYRNAEGSRDGQTMLSMHRSALDRLGSAAGLSCVPELCQRVDDGADPLVCRFRVVGKLRGMDGADMFFSATRSLDLREGSPAVIDILANARDEAVGEKQLRRTRAFIVEHTETKAWSRLVRKALGLRHTYTPDELAKPFVAGKLVWTGDFGDADTNRMVALMSAAQALGMGDALFRAVGATMLAGVLPSATPQAQTIPADVFDDDAHDDDAHDDEPVPPPSDDDAPPPPVDVPPEPTPRGSIDQLVRYTAEKGRLGLGPGRMSEVSIRALAPMHQCRLWAKLDAIEDDPIPF